MLMCDEITLQIAQSSDLVPILRIWMNGWYHVHPNKDISNDQIEQFKLNFREQQFPFGFWVAKSNNQIAGWVSILPAFYHPMKDKSDAEISIYIDKPRKNQGLGTLITSHVLSEISNSSIKNVWAFVSLHNLHSKRMCEKAGLKVCGQTNSKYLLIKEFD